MKQKMFFMVAAVAFFVTVNAQANVDFGLNVDWNKFENAKDGDWGVGARLAFGDGGLDFVTSFDYYFVEADDLFTEDNFTSEDLNLKFFEINGNLTYTFPTGAVRPYLGAGIGVSRRTFDKFFEDIVDDDANRNKLGFNVLGGAKFGSGAASPFIELRGTFYSGENFPDRFIVSGGIIF